MAMILVMTERILINEVKKERASFSTCKGGFLFALIYGEW